MKSAPVARLWLVVLCGYLALGATLQELPGYLTEHFHAGTFTVAAVVGIAFAATAAVRPLAGRAGDVGRSWVGATVGAVLTSVGALGHLLAPGLGWLIVARLVMGAGEAALFSATLPWVLSAAAPGRSGRVAGWFGLSMWSGLSVGPLLAAGLSRVGGSGAVWLTTVLLPVVALVLLLTVYAARPPARTGRERLRLRDLVPAGSALPGLVLGLSAYGYGTLTALLVLFLTRSVGAGQAVGLAVFSVAFLLTRAVGSPLVDRVGGLRVAVVVTAVEAIGFVGLAALPGVVAALVSVAVIGVGVGLIYPASSRTTLARVPAAAAGAGVGTMTSFWDLGILVAGPVGGLLAGRAGFGAAFATAAGAAALAMVVAGWQTRRERVAPVDARLSAPAAR